MLISLAALALTGLGMVAPSLIARADADAGNSAAGGGRPAVPRPGPKHDLLKRGAGVWDATIQIAAEGGVLEVYNGTEISTLVAGGLWLVSEFTSQIGGAPFEGHGILGYDPLKEKYTRVWVDSSQAIYWPSEGGYDPETGTLTMWTEALDSAGEKVRWRTETIWKDADTRTFVMYAPGSEETEAAGMTITYKRRRT